MKWENVSIIDLEARVAPEIFARGREYQQTGHIIRACRLQGMIAGEVAGTGGAYRVRLTLDNERIDGVCSCPYPGFCKHMVALALAWIEKSVEFHQLDSYLESAIKNPEGLPELFSNLVKADPFNFLDLVTPAVPQEAFTNSRGVLNLIRNTFQGQLLTPEQIEGRWERVKRIAELIGQAVARREKEAPLLLGTLLQGVAGSFRDYPDRLLEKLFRELLPLAKELQRGWIWEEILPLVAVLWELYNDHSLWELADAVRPLLADFYGMNPEWFLEKLAAVEWRNLERPQLILLYEFLAPAARDAAAPDEYFQRVAAVLNETPEGQLWLIDRVVEDDPDRAFQMAKAGIRNCSRELKQAFRERLIGIHLRRGEKKQAASLSFIQFQEAPNLEEYHRLKELLAGDRREFLAYLKKMEQLIEGEGLDRLAAEIAFEQGDWVKLAGKLERLPPGHPCFKELAKLLMTENSAAPKEIFQAVIDRLLAGGYGDWGTALSLLAAYKKLCLKNSRREEWDGYRTALNAVYGEDRKFTRKFGAVLTG